MLFSWLWGTVKTASRTGAGGTTITRLLPSYLLENTFTWNICAELSFFSFKQPQRLLDPVKIERWAIVNFSARCDMSRISRELINCGRSKGIVSLIW